jgi:hypothetical protein
MEEKVMKVRVYFNDVLLFEASGELLLTRDILKIAGFDGKLDELDFRIVDDVAEIRFQWVSDQTLDRTGIDDIL